MFVDLFSESVIVVNLLDTSSYTYGNTWISLMGRPGFVPTLCLLEIYDRLSKGTKKSVPELEKVSAQIAG